MRKREGEERRGEERKGEERRGEETTESPYYVIGDQGGGRYGDGDIETARARGKEQGRSYGEAERWLNSTPFK